MKHLNSFLVCLGAVVVCMSDFLDDTDGVLTGLVLVVAGLAYAVIDHLDRKRPE